MTYVLRLAALVLLAGAAAAQEVAEQGAGAMLRALDKINGEVRELDLVSGDTVQVGSLSVHLSECRYSVDNPDGDAYALLKIRETGTNRGVFSGWMVASSPALNPLEHPRYDIWVLRCKI